VAGKRAARLPFSCLLSTVREARASRTLLAAEQIDRMRPGQPSVWQLTDGHPRAGGAHTALLLVGPFFAGGSSRLVGTFSQAAQLPERAALLFEPHRPAAGSSLGLEAGVIASLCQEESGGLEASSPRYVRRSQGGLEASSPRYVRRVLGGLEASSLRL